MGPDVLSSAQELWPKMSPCGIIDSAFANWRGGLALAASFGIETGVLIDLVTKVDPETPIITIDTGYLPDETLAYREELVSWFARERDIALNLHVCRPEFSPRVLEARYGKLWESDRRHYNELVKLAPMRRAIKRLGVDALFYGMRRGQTAERAQLGPVERPAGGIVQIYPFFFWDRAMVNAHLLHAGIPQHPLAPYYEHVGDRHFLDDPAQVECGLKTLALVFAA
ncbi:MAG TPA: phosphoadenosine phosphosulfate reductase family protein [Candidatus Paceibacterota bacterium]|nr:phosphoadenosine phosphosulfate reductase family protein [Candidatus Paceibacterota bacterium]